MFKLVEQRQEHLWRNHICYMHCMLESHVMVHVHAHVVCLSTASCLNPVWIHLNATSYTDQANPLSVHRAFILSQIPYNVDKVDAINRNNADQDFERYRV